MNQRKTLHVQIGDTVSIHFTCKLKNGDIFDSSSGKDPLQFTAGSEDVMKSLDRAVIGMRIGETKIIEVSSGEAFGPYRKEMRKIVQKNVLAYTGKLMPGQSIDFVTENGLIQKATIIGINESGVILDSNHPLAGKDLIFEIQLVDVVKSYRKDAMKAVSSGNAFANKGQLNEAIRYYEEALRIDPEYALAYNNLGTAFKDKGNFSNAMHCYEKAIALDPHDYLTYNNLGIVLVSLGKLDEAIFYHRKALQMNPAFTGGYYNLGNAFSEAGKYQEALMNYKQALKFDSKFYMARWAYCITLLPIIYRHQSHITEARRAYSDELRKLLNEFVLLISQDIGNAAFAVGSHQPFLLACQPFNNRDLQHMYGELVCQIMVKRYPQFADHQASPPGSSADPIRVGVVSKYFYWHSVWKIPLRGWIENIDKKRFKIYGYHTGNIKDHATESARQHCYRFIEDIYSFEALCQMIRDDNLHVLLYPEIGMNPTTLRLAALRLAPVQCVSLGHPETTGLPTIDYYLSSELMETSEAEKHYTENLIRLPNLGFAYTPFDISSAKGSRKSFGLRQTAIIYLCTHALFTHLPQYDFIYPHIAKELADCQFIFIAHRSGYVNDIFRERIRDAFRKENLDAEKYVVILPRLTQEQYSVLNCLADIFLDTIGWSANNSSFEAIACDLPIVTLPGNLMRQRHCAAILTMMGMTETIASSSDEYIAFAVRLGKDTKWRRQISEKIAANKHRAYHDITAITALENFLEKVVNERFIVKDL
jgi:predicted O-linked N-acetylglucosamine transferase (SPINDLY family)